MTSKKQTALFRTALHGKVINCIMARQGKSLQILKFMTKGQPEISVNFAGKNVLVTNDLGDKVKKLILKVKDLKEIPQLLLSDFALKTLQSSPQKLQVKFKKVAKDSD